LIIIFKCVINAANYLFKVCLISGIMKIYTQKSGENYLVKLCGELDASNAQAVEKILDDLIQLNPAQIQVDCKDLKYISSRGLGVFISRFQEMEHKQIKFFLFNMREQVLYVFRVLGLEDLMDLRSEKTAVS